MLLCEVDYFLFSMYIDMWVHKYMGDSLCLKGNVINIGIFLRKPHHTRRFLWMSSAAETK